MLELKDASALKISSPSNIAFIKYWGKYGRQLPINPSISMTLDYCRTNFEVEFDREGDSPEINLYFEGERNLKFEKRIQDYCTSILDIVPELVNLRANIKSSNTFPHSAGIASSASAMSTLAVLISHVIKNELDPRFASKLARLASGSAGRSLFPNYSIWGEVDSVKESTNEEAILFSDYHESFSQVCDSIVIISKNEKSVSSSAGHSLMANHPYKEGRIKQAFSNFDRLVASMRKGDWKQFGNILEVEALSLHALMMSSDPSFVLLEPKSLDLMSELKIFRERTSCPVYFTIDAGPNIHVIYPESVRSQVLEFLDSYTLENGCDVIHDKMGEGPVIEVL